MTRFESLLRQLIDSESAVDSITADEILEAMNESFPVDRRTRFLTGMGIDSRSEFDDPPPEVLQGIDWYKGAYRVMNVAQVKEIVAAAKKAGRRVRVAGARHSTEEAVFSPSSRDYRIVLGGELQKVLILRADENGADVSVGGGCYLGINPSDPLSTEKTSLNHILEENKYALPVLGGISHQTVAGFMQTSSAGGSLAHGFADAVQEIELVDGKAICHTLKRGTREFDAAGVSVGLFGVVTRVMLRVGKTYFVTGREINLEQRDSLLHPGVGGTYPLAKALEDDEYLHLNWFPQPQVKRVTQWTGRRPDKPGDPDPYESELKSIWMNVLAAAVLWLTSVLLLEPNDPRVQRVVGSLLKRFVPLDRDESFNDQWLTTLPCDDQARVDTLIKVMFTEVWLPLDQLTPAMQRLERLLAQPQAAGNFAVELYGAKASPFWLSPSFKRDVVRVDVFWWAYSIGNAREHFERFWEVLLDLPDARLHWGKHLPDVGKAYGTVVFDRELLRLRYPYFDHWLKMRSEMDPDGVFVTPYWKSIFGL